MTFLEHCFRTYGGTHNKTVGNSDAGRVTEGRSPWYVLGPDPSCNGKPVLLWTFPHSLQSLSGCIFTYLPGIQDLNCLVSS